MQHCKKVSHNKHHNQQGVKTAFIYKTERVLKQFVNIKNDFMQRKTDKKNRWKTGWIFKESGVKYAWFYSSMASEPKRSAHDLDLLPGVCLKK